MVGVELRLLLQSATMNKRNGRLYITHSDTPVEYNKGMTAVQACKGEVRGQEMNVERVSLSFQTNSKSPNRTRNISSSVLDYTHTAMASPPKSESNRLSSTKSLLRCVPVVRAPSSIVSVSDVRMGVMPGMNVPRPCAPAPSDSIAICVAEWLMNGVVWSPDMLSATRRRISVGAMPYVFHAQRFIHVCPHQKHKKGTLT